MQTIQLQPIGIVHSSRDAIKDDYWGDVVSTIVLDETRFGPEALQGLDQFSHVEVLFFMDRVAPDKVRTGARSPRNLAHIPPLGIFAQRAKGRPNQLGLTCCPIVAVEGTRLQVRALDAIDGTPVLDLKPHLRAFGPRESVREPDWVADIMGAYFEAEIPSTDS